MHVNPDDGWSGRVTPEAITNALTAGAQRGLSWRPGAPVRRRHFKSRKLEAGRHRAAHERPCAEAARGLPVMRRHDQLRALARGKVRPKDVRVFTRDSLA